MTEKSKESLFAVEPELDPEAYGGWVVISRYQHQLIKIGDVYVGLSKVTGKNSAKLAIRAPRSISIDRLETLLTDEESSED